MRTITVNLGTRSYPIIIKNGLLCEIAGRLAGLGFKGKAAVITNPLIAGLYGKRFTRSLESAGLKPVLITVPDGEEYKTLKEVSSVYDSLIDNKFERSSPLIALGGGVIGDMAGFAAATYLRGVPYIQVPTTLLSQVDSSVGGKTAVNHPKGKNLIGAFYQPRAVFIDPQVLSTLDRGEMRAGLAEVVKYGVIRDRDFFRFLEANSGSLMNIGPELTAAIEGSCRIKAEVVGSDETESGLRSVLNFGHTFGHAIEALSGYGSFRHGEAVAIGMAMASAFSVKRGLCSADVDERIKKLLKAIGLPVLPPSIQPDAFIESMKLDKKVSDGRIRFVLASEIGKVALEEAGEDEIISFLAGFKGD